MDRKVDIERHSVHRAVAHCYVKDGWMSTPKMKTDVFAALRDKRGELPRGHVAQRSVSGRYLVVSIKPDIGVLVVVNRVPRVVMIGFEKLLADEIGFARAIRHFRQRNRVARDDRA